MDSIFTWRAAKGQLLRSTTRHGPGPVVGGQDISIAVEFTCMHGVAVALGSVVEVHGPLYIFFLAK